MKTVKGYCREGCGACCSWMAVPIRTSEEAQRYRSMKRGERVTIPLHANTHDWVHFLTTRGAEIDGAEVAVQLDDAEKPVRVGTYAGSPAAYLRTTCPMLVEGWKCSLHGTPDKPRVCSDWPTPADDVWIVEDVCTYEITDEAT